MGKAGAQGMKFAWLGKLVAVAATVLVLAIVLARIGWLVDERQAYQAEAVHSVQQSYAGAQTLLGPVLQRHCSEEWQVPVGEGKSRRLEPMRRNFTLSAVARNLVVDSDSQADARYRGLFKVNGYQAKVQMQALWADLSPLRATRETVGSKISCKPTTVWLATTDVRGLRTAQLSVVGASPSEPLAVRPGTGREEHPNGLQAELPGFAEDGSVPSTPLALRLAVQLVGTAQLALVPAAESVQWTLRSDWPHPSFGGRFLPTQREVGDSGFSAQWAVSALASAAARQALRGGALCNHGAGTDHARYAAAAAGGSDSAKPCLDTLSVSFIDPVNPYSLSDRAIKYGLLFVLLTFTAVGLAEALARERVRRVHPVQYALVGLALCFFFLLLLSLSEHLVFVQAYSGASAAVVLLLGVYARHMLGRLRDGVLFGAGIALLYGLLYLLLLQEQTALLIGSLGLFLALAAVMLLTRRLDWYRLSLPRLPEAGPVATPRGAD
jgi:inner membrane protein